MGTAQVDMVTRAGERSPPGPARMAITRLDEREVVRADGEVDRPWTRVKLDVYPQASRVVVELSRQRWDGEPEALAMMLDAREARSLVRVLVQALRTVEGGEER